MRRAISVVLFMIASSAFGMAQSVPVDHATQAGLLEKAQELKKKADAGNGSASIKLNEYPNHFTMLSYRERSGGGEQHDNFADFFYVLKGNATLLTGGTLVNPSTSGPGEMRGTAVSSKTQTALHPGDIVHIPAKTPHQLVIADGQEFVYFVVKVREQ